MSGSGFPGMPRRAGAAPRAEPSSLQDSTLGQQVFPCLSGLDLARCGAVSKEWRRAHDLPELWEGACASIDSLGPLEQFARPREAFAAYVGAMQRWRSGTPAATAIRSECLLEHGIGDEDICVEDVTAMICSLVLEGDWLVVAFNGGCVQFWHLPATDRCGVFSAHTNILDVDVDTQGRRFCAAHADLSVLVYDCSEALAGAEGALLLPVVGRYLDCQACPRSIAFWGPGFAVAMSRSVQVLGRAFDVAYSVHDCPFWDLIPSFLAVEPQERRVDACAWSSGGLSVVSHELARPYELLSAIEGPVPQLLCEIDGHICLLRLGDEVTEVSRVLMHGEVALPLPLPGGAVWLLQISREQGGAQSRRLFCDGRPCWSGRMVVASGELVAAEALALEPYGPAAAYLTFAQDGRDAPELMLMRLPDGTPQRLGRLDFGTDEDPFLESTRVFTASSWQFFVATDRAGVHVLQFSS